MELEGSLELSLNCLALLSRPALREQLVYPLILQVVDSSECQCRVKSHPSAIRDSGLRERLKQTELRRLLAISDGFIQRSDSLILVNNEIVEPFSIIKVHNIEFESIVERQRNRQKILGVLLEYEIVRTGSEIGYFSGTPLYMRDKLHNGPGRERGLISHLLTQEDRLSNKLWKQVKEERCCDVTFSFPTHQIATVKAQRSVLIANSPVFEAQFEGNFCDATSDLISVEDTEPKYMRCLLQFVFTRFVPLLNLTQAFQLLYLARKYMIQDMERFCKNFILNNQQSISGAPDVFLYLHMNEKACDDEIGHFVWNQFRLRANVLIRLPMFTQLDFTTLETFLSEPGLNCHEWELIQAIRRWVIANNHRVKCDDEELEVDANCAHQLTEAIRWSNMPVKEAVMAASWQEFSLHRDPTFLTDVLEKQKGKEGSSICHTEVVPVSFNRQYSLNRMYHDDSNFVIYSNLTVDPLTLKVNCLHGQAVSGSTQQQTRCETVGPPFEMLSFYLVPSYGLANCSSINPNINLTVNLSCQGKSFNADSFMIKSTVKLTVFSFNPRQPAKEVRKWLNFWPDRDSSNSCTVMFDNLSDLSHYLHPVRGGDGKVRDELDVQLQFNTEIVTGQERGRGRGSPPRIMRPLRTSLPRLPIKIDDVGLSRRYRGGRGERTLDNQDGWGDVNRSPQSRWDNRTYSRKYYRSHHHPSPTSPNTTIEVDSDRSEAYGDITRSPQSPGQSSDTWESGFVTFRSRSRSPFPTLRNSPLRNSRSPSPRRAAGFSRSPSPPLSPQPGTSRGFSQRFRSGRRRRRSISRDSPSPELNEFPEPESPVYERISPMYLPPISPPNIIEIDPVDVDNEIQICDTNQQEDDNDVASNSEVIDVDNFLIDEVVHEDQDIENEHFFLSADDTED